MKVWLLAAALLSLGAQGQERFPKPDPARAFAELKVYAGGSPLRSPKEDWDEARNRVRSDPRWTAWLKEQQADCDAWMEAHATDRVEWIAGWWHDYVDEKTGAFLPWTPAPPADVTGKVLGGWVFGFRSRHTQKMVQAARLWRLTGEARYADWVIRQLNFYAENYEKWPLQTEKSKARLMHQSLDEANVLVRLVEAARLVRERAAAGRQKDWAERLLRPMALLVDETFQRVHNIAVWQRSAMAMAALYLRDGELWRRAVDAPFGLRRQMADGVTGDYLWIEQSFGYNSYVVSAVLPLFVYAGLEGRLNELRREAEIAENLMLAPSVLRFPEGRLPVPADTTGGFQRWPNAGLMEAARRVFPTWIGVEAARKRLGWDTLLDPLEEDAGRRGGAVPEVRSRSLESSRMAVLKQDEWQLFFHYGQLDPSHAQAEALNWEAVHSGVDITHDAGTVGYGSPLHREFYTRGHAHNVVLVDGEGQQRWAPGELLAFDPARVAARQPQYRENASVERELRIPGGVLEDRVKVETTDQREHRIGLVLHLQGRVRLPESFRKDPEFALKHWEDARTAEFLNEAVLLVDYPGLVLEVKVSAGALLRVTHASTPDIAPHRRESLYFELTGQRAEFVTTLRVVRQAPAPPPAAADDRTETQRRRVELNLLGAADTEGGESRRNENIQFNLVDNNALKELNVRLGVTATIVREFEPQRGYFGAEFGNPPSAPPHAPFVSGKEFHGELRWAHLNSVTTARTFFQVGDVKPARENDAGFRAGGRAWRNAWWQTHGSLRLIRGQVNGNVLVPRADERTALAADPAVRAVVQRFLDAYPLETPNRTDIDPRALNTNAPQNIDHRMGGARLDAKAGARDALALAYDFTSQDVDAFQLVAGQNPDTHIKSHRARATWTRTPDARTVMEATAGFDRVGTMLVPEPNFVGPMVLIGGLETLGPHASIPLDRALNTYRAAGAWRRQAGARNWLAGFEVARRQMNGAETDAHRGFFSFWNDFGRDSMTNLRMGTPTQHLVSIGDVHRGFRNWEAAAYAGGRWRWGGAADVSWGLRWQAATKPSEVNGRNTIAYDSDWNNWAPSLGVARRLGTVGALRASAGVQFGEIFPVTYSQVRFSPPGSVKIAVPAPDLLQPLRSGAERAKGNIYELDKELSTPYSYQYNASWERELGRLGRLEAGYVGSRSHRLLIMWYRNRGQPVPGVPLTTATINDRRPDTSISDWRWVLNGSRGYYDAGRVTWVMPQWRGASIEAAYWWSKAMDLGSAYTNTAYDADSRLSRSQWEFETHRDMKGLSDFDQPHAFLWRGAWRVPGRRRVLRNWDVTGVMLLKQGTPFTVSAGSDAPGYGNVDGNGGDRPHLLDPAILGRTIGDPDTSRQRLPRAAFAYQKPGEMRGSLGRNTFRRGRIANLNASLGRTWTSDSARRVMLRAESVNLTNTPQFAPPGHELANPNFGAITNTLNEGRTFRFLVQIGW